jgi:phosphomannomutase
MSQIKFGTDGWRAVIAEDFTRHFFIGDGRIYVSFWHDSGRRTGWRRMG